jgi:hypothetical protein
VNLPGLHQSVLRPVGDTPRQIWLRLEEDFHARNNAVAVA